MKVLIKIVCGVLLKVNLIGIVRVVVRIVEMVLFIEVVRFVIWFMGFIDSVVRFGKMKFIENMKDVE